MITVLKNLGILLGLYIPLTALLGLVTGAFHAPGAERSISYELFLWFVVAIQLLVPTLLVYVGVYFLVTKIIYLSPTRAPMIASVAFGLGLPLAQALAWGGNELSVEWLIVSVLPAMMLGLMTRFPSSSSLQAPR